MESEELRYLHFLGPAWAPALEEEDAPEDEAVVPSAVSLAEDSDADADKDDHARPEEAPPPGETLMAAVADGLRALGWHCDYTWATYRGHGLDARRVKKRYDIELWLVDAEAGRWEIMTEPRRGLFRKIFQARRDNAEEALLRLQIGEVLEKTQDVMQVSPWQTSPYHD